MAANTNSTAGENAMSGSAGANHIPATAGKTGLPPERYLQELKLFVDNGLGLSNAQSHRNAIDRIAGDESQCNQVPRSIWHEVIAYAQARLRPVQDEVNVLIGRVSELATTSIDFEDFWPHDNQGRRPSLTGANATEDILSLSLRTENQVRNMLAGMIHDRRVKMNVRAKVTAMLNERLKSMTQARQERGLDVQQAMQISTGAQEPELSGRGSHQAGAGAVAGAGADFVGSRGANRAAWDAEQARKGL